MLSPGRKLSVRVEEAIVSASQFLAARQDRDGYWRDYVLPPGRSEAWTTACVGYALSQGGQLRSSAKPVLDHAAESLLLSRRPEGWGYNRHTACDADTTAWVIRFLAQVDAMNGVFASELLFSYMAASGGIRTFGSQYRFGRWAGEHDEVAPLAGLALLAAGENHHASTIRSSILSRWEVEEGWKPFWWHNDAYVSAQSLTFLRQSGGIPKHIAADERSKLFQLPPPESAFEMAQRLAAATHLVSSSTSERFCNDLLTMQLIDGGWPSSLGLLVPSQGDSSEGKLFADDQRLLSTAMAVIALTSWQHAREASRAFDSFTILARQCRSKS
jgi:hypothetical protein